MVKYLVKYRTTKQTQSQPTNKIQNQTYVNTKFSIAGYTIFGDHFYLEYLYNYLLITKILPETSTATYAVNPTFREPAHPQTQDAGLKRRLLSPDHLPARSRSHG